MAISQALTWRLMIIQPLAGRWVAQEPFVAKCNFTSTAALFRHQALIPLKHVIMEQLRVHRAVRVIWPWRLKIKNLIHRAGFLLSHLNYLDDCLFYCLLWKKAIFPFHPLAISVMLSLWRIDHALTIFFFHRLIFFVTFRVSITRGACFTTQW